MTADTSAQRFPAARSSNRNSSCGATPSNSLSPTVGMVDSGAGSTPPVLHPLIKQLRGAAVGQPGAPRTQPGQITESRSVLQGWRCATPA